MREISNSRIALVTGAARGIGRACAERLAADGLTVVSMDRAEIVDPPGPAVRYDLGDLDGIEDALAGIAADVGPVDVLVNNAAMLWMTPLDSLTLADLRAMIDVNLVAGVQLAAAAGRAMRKRGWGRIVWISSVKDHLGERGALPYDVAKGGVAQATRSLAVELGGDGVLVNAVAPGFVRTDLSVIDGVNELDMPEFRRYFVESGRIPLGRAADPPEIAACVSWLASADNTYVNGAVLRADGGLSVTL